MRKVIGPKLETVKVPSTRIERSAGNPEYFDRVVRMYGEKVKVLVRGTKKVIIRPRLKSDPPGLVPYVVISGEHYTAEEAWRDASYRVQNLGNYILESLGGGLR